ncbi:MAG: ABC transporter substrate-binding protein [Euryarchaeota archaeon]|nr:ABC transporter substrate-binding protein [Euryarchaeota archaeon]
MKKTLTVSIIVVLVIASFAAGYALNISINSKPSTTSGINSNPPTPSGITVLDDDNNIVTVPQPVNRIVSLAPSCTEIAFALGLGNKVVGDTIYDDFPNATKNITKVGGLTNISVEGIVALKPDLVLAYPLNYQQGIQKLKSLGIPVLILDPKNLQGILHDLILVGYVTGTYSNATKLSSMINSWLFSLYNVTSTINNKSKVFYLGWYPELWTAGEDTFINEMIVLAGGINIASGGYSWFIMSKEYLLTQNPQWIIISQYQESLIPQIENDSSLSNITAIKERNFIVLNDYLLQQPGPQIFIGVELLFETLYPNLKNEIPQLTLQEIFPGYNS